jgi:WD40 repeat protein/transcriptional regulator with XRE-family HTH domain
MPQPKAATKIVASRIRRLRDDRGWSARKLAEECASLGMRSLTREIIAKIETGRRDVNVDEMDVLAAALGVTVQALLVVPAITVLHLSDLMLAPDQILGAPVTSWPDLLGAICTDLSQIDDSYNVRPDVVVVSGNLALSGRNREFDLVKEFLEGLAGHLRIGLDRVAIVPGAHDVNVAACRAYLAECDANDQDPVKPYWANWKHFAKLFDSWPRDDGLAVMQHEQPWSLFEIKDLRIVVAGLNSTVDADAGDRRPGSVGAEQVEWFQHQLRRYEREGWLRIGAVSHNPVGALSDLDALGDADLLDRELGPHLNLVLHGRLRDDPIAGASASGAVASGAFVLGAGSGSADTMSTVYQLVRFTADGVSRMTRRATLTPHGEVDIAPSPGGWSTVSDRQLPGTGLTFPTSSARVVPRSEDEWSEPSGLWAVADSRVDQFRDLDSQRALLDRVADIFVVRHPGGVVHRVSGALPMLRVTYNDGPTTRQQRIGACIGDVKEADVDAFVARVHGADFDEDSELIVDGGDVPRRLRDYAGRRGVRLRTFLEYQTVVDLTQYVELQEQRLTNDARYLPSDYVTQTFIASPTTEPADHGLAQSREVREDVVGEMLRLVGGDEGRFILLLGDFGRGKTFALRELARRISTELSHLTPVLIDLRALDKSNTVEAHIAAHLTMHGHEEFDLRVLRYLLHIGRLVLIFDGFDELVARATYDRAAEHLQTLLAAAQDRAKIVVASRTQHFQTSAQVRTAMGARVDQYPQRQVLTLTAMSRDQIHTLLVRHFGTVDRADKHLALLDNLAGLAELARNPRMLGFIAQLDEARLRAVAGADGAISMAGLYQQILDAWLSYEHHRTQGIPGAPAGLELDDLWHAVTELAVRIWETDEVHIDIRTLGNVAATLIHLASGRLTTDQITHAVGAGTLLVRDEDTDYFTFIHESVVEWLVAREIARELALHQPPRSGLLDRKVLTGLTIDFLSGLADPKLCRDWATTTLDRAGSATAHANASRIIARLSSAPGLNLRALSLHGEELSNRVWPEANLQGADLSTARLLGVNFSAADLTEAQLDHVLVEGADLSRANLSGANLRHARIVRTSLAGADLSGADLTDARLMDVDLTGAAVTGSTWLRTALVSATAEPDLLRQIREGGATVLPDDRVLEVATLPARIGVRFGFDEGRLPRPLAYDHEGALLALGNEDGTVLVCDAEDGRPLRTLVGHTERTYAVMFHPAAPMLATGSRDGTARLWDVTVGAQKHELRDHPGWVWPMVFNADGTLLATGANDGSVRVWQTATGKRAAVCRGHTPPVWTATFDPAGGVLATGDDGGRARVFSLKTGQPIHTLDTSGAKVFWLRYRRTAEAGVQPLLIGGCDDHLVRVWDSSTGELVHCLAGHTGPVYALDFHPFSDYIISADVNGNVIQWKLHTDGSPPERVDLPSHRGAAVYRVTFSPAGRLFATGDSDGGIRLWDADRCEPAHELTRHHASVWPMMFRPDGERLATSSNDFTVKVWNTRDGALVGTLAGHERRVNMVSFSRDDSLLATSGNDGSVRLWNPRTGELKDRLGRSPDRLVSAVFGPQAPLLATASNDGRVLVWTGDRHDGEVRFEAGRMVDLNTDNVWATAFDPDGDRLATANDDGSVEVIYFRTGRSIGRLSRDGGRVRTLAFSPDGRVLATGGDGSRVRLRDPDNDRSIGELEHHTDRVFSLAYRPDGNILATASHDGTVALWDTTTLTRIRVLRPDRGRLWTVAFHPGGRLMASAGDRQMIDIWDADSGDHLAELPGHLRRVCSVAFSHNGEIMASSSIDGTVRLWWVKGDQITHTATLMGLADGWVAFTPAGRYKAKGTMQGEFWHAAGMIRFEPGELAAFVPGLRELPAGAALF